VVWNSLTENDTRDNSPFAKDNVASSDESTNPAVSRLTPIVGEEARTPEDSWVKFRQSGPHG